MFKNQCCYAKLCVWAKVHISLYVEQGPDFELIIATYPPSAREYFNRETISGTVYGCTFRMRFLHVKSDIQKKRTCPALRRSVLVYILTRIPRLNGRVGALYPSQMSVLV